MIEEVGGHHEDHSRCILFIFGCKAHILIDPGSMHSFISRIFSMHVNQELKPLDCCLVVNMPIREPLLAENIFWYCIIGLGEHKFKVNLIDEVCWMDSTCQ